MKKNLKEILRPFYPIIGAGYSRCNSCDAPWNIVDGHTVWVSERRGCFAVCEDCWELEPDDKIIEAFSKRYDSWINGDELNPPYTEEEIGYTKEHLLNCVKRDLKKRK